MQRNLKKIPRRHCIHKLEKKKGEKINRILIIYREKKKKKLSRFEIFTGVNEPENIRTYKGWGNTIKIVVRLQNDMSGCVGRLE